MEELIDLFIKLVEINSVSGNEEEISNFIIKYLRDLGLEPIQDKNNMIYVRNGNKPNPKLFCSHMDTVQPGNDIKVITKNGYLESAGKTILGADNKVSLCSILYSVKKLLSNGASPNIELLFTVREETNGGVREINKSLLKSKVGYIYDGGREKLGWCVIKAPFLYDFEIKINGKSTHASTPELGNNVIPTLTKFLNSINLGRLNSSTTLNIGVLEGGDATNTIPSSVFLAGDLRSTDEQNFKKIKREIDNTINSLNNEDTPVTINWIPFANGYSLNTESINYKHLQKIYSTMNIELEPTETTGGSDAGFLNSIGIETFCLGDGVIDAHTTQERIKLSNFYKLQEIVEILMTS